MFSVVVFYLFPTFVSWLYIFSCTVFLNRIRLLKLNGIDL